MIQIRTSAKDSWFMVYDDERRIGWGCPSHELISTIHRLPTRHWSVLPEHLEAQPILLATISHVDELQHLFPELFL